MLLQHPQITDLPASTRGAAPPPSARVVRRAPEGADVVGEDTDGDEEDEYLAHGADVPMSPERSEHSYVPTSPASLRESPMSMDAVSVFDGDIKPVLNLLEGSPLHQREVLEHNVEILKLVDEIGSGSHSYSRHRRTALKRTLCQRSIAGPGSLRR